MLFRSSFDQDFASDTDLAIYAQFAEPPFDADSAVQSVEQTTGTLLSDQFLEPEASSSSLDYFSAPAASPVLAATSALVPSVSPAAATPGSVPSPDRTITRSPSPEQESASAGPSVPVVSTSAYPAYSGSFSTGEAARDHRRKSKRTVTRDPNLSDVKKQRGDWVRRIYDAMVDTSAAIDNHNFAQDRKSVV